MRPTFMGLNIASNALLAHQQSLDVIGHNIANASVAGYSRQRLHLAAVPAALAKGFRPMPLSAFVTNLLTANTEPKPKNSNITKPSQLMPSAWKPPWANWANRGWDWPWINFLMVCNS
jgi:flagellar basal body rod protein FlgG